MDLKGKNVLITGASSGIGAALAWEFAERGCHLVLLARRTERLEYLAQQLSRPDRKVVRRQCDVTRDGDVEAAVEQARRDLGPMDVVIANAGFGVVGPVEKLSLEDYRRQFETNVFGVLRTVKATLADLKETRGRLAVVGSVNGFVSLPGNSPYGMSKFAVRTLCDSLYHELGRYGISVTHIAPGFVATEIRQVDNRGQWHSGFEDRVPSFLQMPADRAARIIARAIVARRRERVVTAHGHVATWLARHCPNLYHFLVKSLRVSARLAPKT